LCRGVRDLLLNPSLRYPLGAAVVVAAATVCKVRKNDKGKRLNVSLLLVFGDEAAAAGGFALVGVRSTLAIFAGGDDSSFSSGGDLDLEGTGELESSSTLSLCEKKQRLRRMIQLAEK